MYRHKAHSISSHSLVLWGLLVLGFPVISLGVLLDDADFRAVPIVAGEPLHGVHTILREAANSPRRILIFGDSQETSPSGAGSVYVPHLQMQFKNRFRYVGETPFYGFSSMGSGQPGAAWLVGVSNGSMGPEYILDSTLPPGMLGTRNRLPQEGSDQELGSFFILLHDASLTRDDSLGNEEVMNPSSSIVAEILVRQTGKASGARYIQRPTDNYNTWTANIGEGTFKIGQIKSAPGYALGQSAPLSRGNKNYHRVEIFGDNLEIPTEILAVRFADISRRIGIVAHSFSLGGYTSNSLRTLHGLCGGVLNAVGGHLAILQYGANDVVEVGPEEFENRLHQLIDFIRNSVNDPCFPIIIAGDGWRYLPPELEARQDAFPGAAARVARSRERVTALNMRRVMEEKYPYWGEGKRDHVIDGVHLSAEAQVDLAETLANIILPPIDGSCRGDFNGDGTVDGYDLGLLVSEYGSGESNPNSCAVYYDLNGDGYVNTDDFDLILELIGDCPAEYFIETLGPSLQINVDGDSYSN